MALTEQKIRNTKSSDKRYKLGDGEGLHLLVHPNGGKYWQFKYRFANKERLLSLGRYPEVKLSEARVLREDARRQLREGHDPNEVRKRDKLTAIYRDRNTLKAVAEEWFDRNADSWTKHYAEDTWNRLKNHIFPTLGSQAISAIQPLELLSVIQRIEKRGKTDMSHRVLRITSAVYDFAIITGRAQHNITTGLLKALKRHQTKNYPTLKPSEVTEFLGAFQALGSIEQNRLAFRLLLLTAVRTGEMRYSKWSDIDFEKREWHLRPEIMKMRSEHLVPLSRQTVRVLRKLEQITGDSEWLLPTTHNRVHEVVSENLINDMIKRMGLNLDHPIYSQD